MKTMNFELVNSSGSCSIEITCRNVYVVGYSGRNVESVKTHIQELEEQIGAKPPEHVPEIYPCSPEILSQNACIACKGEKTSGEVEFVIVLKDGHIYVGIGSDHTDREIERDSVLEAKHKCPKIMGQKLWDYEDLKGHWDSIEMISWQKARREDEWTDYQKGTLSLILPLETILEELKGRQMDLADSIIFWGQSLC